MKSLIRLFLKYPMHLKYGFLIAVIFSMIISIRTYLNYVAIEDSIYNVRQDINETQEEIRYVEKFQVPYLASQHADYFLAHENNRLFPGEFIIRLEETHERDDNTETNGTAQKTITNPQKARQHFRQQKLEDNRG